MSNENKESDTIVDIIRVIFKGNADAQTITSVIRQNTSHKSYDIPPSDDKSTRNLSKKRDIQIKQLPGNPVIQQLKDVAIDFLISRNLDLGSYIDLFYNISTNTEKLKVSLNRCERLLEVREKRFHELNMKSAVMGVSVDPHVTTEMDDLKVLINEYNVRIEILNYWIN